jgi:hypothetical protein
MKIVSYPGEKIGGLSNVYEHFIDIDGHKLFITYNPFYGEFIRQIQSSDKDSFWYIDESSPEFKTKMLELGYKHDEKGLFRVSDNTEKIRWHVPESFNGIAKDKEEVPQYYKLHLDKTSGIFDGGIQF